MEPTILIVDDELDMLTVLELMLERVGYRVVTANDGAHALELLSTITPDLVITDISMPNVDGIDLCNALRTRGQTLKTPIIVLSAIADNRMALHCAEAGADKFLIKPIFQRDLAREVGELLNGAPVG